MKFDVCDVLGSNSSSTTGNNSLSTSPFSRFRVALRLIENFVRPAGKFQRGSHRIWPRRQAVFNTNMGCLDELATGNHPVQ